MDQVILTMCQALEELRNEYLRPSRQFPVQLDCDNAGIWHCHFGHSRALEGTGETPEKAAADFDVKWYRK